MRIVMIFVLAALASGQTAAPPSFDAASIKPSNADPQHSSSGIDTTDTGLFRAYNVTLKRCIIGAYGIPGAQILGGPGWIDELRYDIVAKTDRKAGDSEQMMMLRSLLADRFQLSFHRETRRLSGYALTVAKGGIKAKESVPEANSSTDSRRGRIDAKGMPISQLAIKLSGVTDVPVVDMTQEKRKFDFSLQWSPDEMQTKSGASSGVPDGPSLFTALQEQLGLKLEARKVPVEVLVIDRAELPSEN